MSYTIITDSCADLNQNMVDELNIDVIPMSFELNGIQYKDYPDQHEMNIKDFYKAMRDKQVSKTAQVTIEEYLEHFNCLPKNKRYFSYSLLFCFIGNL